MPVVIVAFGNTRDVELCLSSVGKQRGVPKMGAFVCENGGSKAFEALIVALTRVGGLAEGPAVPEMLNCDNVFARIVRLRLAKGEKPLMIGQAHQNLGYGGASTRGCVPCCRRWGGRGFGC